MIKTITAFLGIAAAQTRYNPNDADVIEMPLTQVSHYKTFEVDHKFQTSRVWEPRSKLVVGYDDRGSIAELKIDTPVEAKDIFSESCISRDLYQLRIPELDLMTSVDACLYSEHGGLNETLKFNTIDGKELTGFFYEVSDLEYLASKERRTKTKRLMLTADFTAWKTTAVLQKSDIEIEGGRPVFGSGRNYNSMGGEKVEVKKPAEGAAAAEQEQSFFSKYWMYILAALFILPRLIGEDPAPAAAAAPAAS